MNRHVGAVAAGGLLLLVGVVGMFAPELFGTAHSEFREKACALMAGAGGILLAFGDPKAAIDGMARLLPWGKASRASSTGMPAVKPDEGAGPG